MVDVTRDPILQRDHDLLRRSLERDAQKLIAGRSFPLDLGAILDELGIELASGSAERMGKAHGYLCEQDSRWKIIVNASTSTARQRYTIAHELGHFMVEANVGFFPTNRAAYWMLEDVCQAFAGEVLSPSTLVRDLLASVSQTPTGLLDAIPALIERTDLSLEAAARRLIDAAPWSAGLVALDLRPRQGLDGASGQSAAVRWIHASGPWVTAGRGRKFGPRHPLWPLVAAARAGRVGGRAPVIVDSATAAVVERRSSTLALAAVALASPGSSG
jgi:hypothetical protein